MSKDNNVDMTIGNPVSLIVRFAIPMMIGNIFQQLYNLVDSVVVGQFVGSSALAAIGATNSINFLFFALCNGIGSGGGIITSQCFGAGDDSQVKKSISNTAYLMIAFPVVIGAVSFFLVGPLLKLLETPETIMSDALIYARLMCIGLIFVSVYNFISSMLRALGDSMTPLYFLVFSCVLNTVLDVVFVKFLNLSVLGAGVATLIAQFVSGLLCIIYAVKRNPYFKLKAEDLKLDYGIIRKTIRLGIPLSLQFSMIAISCMALQRVVNKFGDIAVSAFTATSRIEQVIHQPYQTLGAALSTYCGQNYGAGKYNRLEKGYRKSMLMMFVFSIAMLPVMQFFGTDIIAVFVNEKEVIDMGAKALQISSLFYAFLGAIYVIRGVLNGVGDAFFAFLNGIVEVLGRFIIPITLISVPLIGVWGIWWSVGIVWFISGLTAWIRYMSFKRKLFSADFRKT
ncbi:MAG: MATE family efflux transporter [Clostridia bacterium]|nr:MATE family efflux transporter [Clostridia bacterium]